MYKEIPGEGQSVVYRPMTQKEFDIIAKLWGKSISITEFCFSTQKVVDDYEKELLIN